MSWQAQASQASTRPPRPSRALFQIAVNSSQCGEFFSDGGHEKLVKILDFGLAKQSGTRSSGAHPTELATQPIETNPGMVLGTVGYMSPEEVRGQAADARSDLFSLGVVLHEMVSGKRAFSGDSSVEVMNAVLKQVPPELDTLAGCPYGNRSAGVR
jgi:serine/threonine protein kinase